jgi:hypothetical protein
MTVTAQLLSEIELLPKEYEQEVFDFVSFLRNKSSFVSSVPSKRGISIESAYGILKGTGIDSNIERDEEDRI